MPTSASPPPQPITAPANPSRPTRKMSTSNSALRVPPLRSGASPMSFGAAMSGISFGNGGTGYSYRGASGDMGSYGARFYGDTSDSPHMPFSSSINMDAGSFANSSSAFGLPMGSMSGSYGRRSYAMAVSLGRDYGAHMLSASLASLTTGNPMGSLSHSYSRGQLETLMTLRSEAEHTKEYECCGIKHDGLHALLEHVEDQHPYSDPNMPDAGFSPVTLAMDLDLEGDGDVPSATHSNRSSTSPRPVPNYPLTPTSATGPKPDPPAAAAPATIAPLQLSDVLKSPAVAESNLSLPKVGSPDRTPTATAASSPTSPFATAPRITPASRGPFLGGPSKTGPSRFDRAFNEVVAGKTGGVEDAASAKPPGPTAVAPGVLFTAAAALGIPSAPAVVGRQNGSTPAPATGGDVTPETKEETKEEAANGDRSKALEPQLPQPSLFTTHKAWRCPNPGCNKAYKQSNGLKYHLQKGQCDFAIHDAIDHGLTLEEAEERSRPYVCAVGAGCTKRYRQMNGLKYHYLNSGDHGQYGLRMLQNGTHPHPPSLPPVPKRDRTQAPPNGAVHPARTTAAPYAVPSQLQRPAVGAHQAPRMGVWPTTQRPANGTSTTATSNATATAQARPAPTAATTANAAAQRPPPPATAAAAPQKMAPVQRGRDAVLFANVGSLDL